MKPVEFYDKFKDKNLSIYEMEGILGQLSQADRKVILEDLPFFIKEKLQASEYALVNNILYAFFNVRINILREQFDDSLFSFLTPSGRRPKQKEEYYREIILALIQSRPKSGPAQAALIQSIKHIMYELLEELGDRIEEITDEYGTNLIYLCVEYFPDLFDLIFKKTKNHTQRNIDAPYHASRLIKFMVRDEDRYYPEEFYIPDNQDALFLAIIKSNRKQTSLDSLDSDHPCLLLDSDHPCLLTDFPILIDEKTLRQDIIRKLVDHNEGNLNTKSYFSMPYLMLAALLGDAETIRYLYDKGARIDMTWDTPHFRPTKDTALIIALRYGREAAVMTLLDCGAETQIVPYFSKKEEKLEEKLKEIQEKMGNIRSNIGRNAKVGEPFMLPNGYHLMEMPVAGDGDCLYSAVALLDDSYRTAQELRQQVQAIIHEGGLSDSLRQDRAHDAAGVREVEIDALTKILGRSIAVIHQSGLAPNRYDTAVKPSGDPLFISYNGRDQYIPLYPVGYTAGEIYSVQLPRTQFLYQELPSDLIANMLSYLQHDEVEEKFNSPYRKGFFSSKRKANETGFDPEDQKACAKRFRGI